MYAHLEKSNENKRRAVANSVGQKRSNAKNDIGRARRMPTRFKLKQVINGETAQRKVSINDKDVTKNNQDDAKVTDGITVWDTPNNGQAIVDDKWKRYFQDFQEFKNYAEGEPVNVGLAKAIGEWYRLDFSTFFVLGETHSELSYQTVIDESNRKGRVLGEKGVLKMGALGQDFFKDEVGAEIEGNDKAKHVSMESPTAKSYFAISKLKGMADNNRLQENTNKNINVKSGGEVLKPIGAEQESDWVAGYEAADDTHKGLNGRVLVYKKGDNWLRQITKYDEHVYSLMDTLKKFLDLIKDTIIDEADQREEIVGIKKSDMGNWVANVKGKLANSTLGVNDVDLANLNSALDTISHEDQKTLESKDIQKLAHRKTKVLQPGNQVNDAMALRDAAMLYGILKGKEHGYIMAGIGNNHLLNLESDLSANNVRTVKKDELPTKPAL